MSGEERELIKKAQLGDNEAFDRLVALHDQQVLQMIQSIVGNLHDAYDVYQETFIRAHKKLSSFRFESELSTWLGRIAINLSINWRKRQRVRQFFSIEGRKDQQVGWEGEHQNLVQKSSESKLMNKELMQQINRSMNKLPEQQRTVFVLKHIHGLKIREISEMMNCADGTVKNHLFRATQKLQKVLQESRVATQ